MASGNEREAFIWDADVDAAFVIPDVHPRILARLKLVALQKVQDLTLAWFDQLIDGLDDVSKSTNRFAIQAVTTRVLRDQLASADLECEASLLLLDQISQHITWVSANLMAFVLAARG